MKIMKRISFCLVITLLFSIFSLFGASALEQPDPDSQTAILIDTESGDVLFEKGADKKIYPASTTKIMTVLLAVEAIENGSVSVYDEVTASESMTYDLVEEGSTAGIQVGETMTLENLLYCAMVSSANEACNIIAEYISGSIPVFISEMNAKAQELGCKGTHFSNTHGLPDSSHYTTARDFSLIAMEAIKHDMIMELCNVPTVTIPETNLSAERHLNNSNALICAESIYGSSYLYTDAAGIKTGHTNDAGYCLISTAKRNGISLLCGVFGGNQISLEDGSYGYTNFSDSILLYDWVFDNYAYREILRSTDTVLSLDVNMGGEKASVSVRPESDITALLPSDFRRSDYSMAVTLYHDMNNEELSAPISAGEVLGEVTVQKDGESYGTVKLVAANSVELSKLQYLKYQVSETIHSKTFRVIFWSVIILLVLYLALVIIYRINYLKRKKARNAARKAAAARKKSDRVAVTGGTGAQQDNRTSSEGPQTRIDYFTPDEPTTVLSPTGKPEIAPDLQQEPQPLPVPSLSHEQSKSENASDNPTGSAGKDVDWDYFEEFFRSK